MPAMVDLLPLRGMNARIRGARIKGVMAGLSGSGGRLVIVTDRVDADTGQALYLVIEGAQRVELMQGVLTVMGAEDDA